MRKPYVTFGIIIIFQTVAIMGVGLAMSVFFVFSADFTVVDTEDQQLDYTHSATASVDSLNASLVTLKTNHVLPNQVPQPALQAENLRPFSLPFAEPPGLDTWLVGQPYGNTTGAYRQRFTTYGASGGIHFGLDLSAPCGTEIVAIADGVVFAVDGPYGSPPHNLMIDHPELGYASMYGHLLEAPNLVPGQQVKRGDVIALSGSSRGECPRGQHLHLEIRDLNHVRKYNPLPLIEADWDNLALYGSSGRGFMRNLDEPRQWQTLYDQPEAFTGGPIVNDFARTWPLDWEKGETNQTVAESEFPQAPLRQPYLEPFLQSVLRIPFRAPVIPPAQRLTFNDCCTNFAWSADSSEIHFIDQPSSADPLGVWGIKVNRFGTQSHLVTQRFAVYNEDRSLMAYPERGLVIVEQVENGQQWPIDTQGNSVSFTPSNHLMWTVSDSEVSWTSRRTEVWLSEIDGGNSRRVITLERGSPMTWLSDDTLLVSSRNVNSEDRLLLTLSIIDGTLTELVRLPNARDVTLSPDKRHLIYLSRFNSDPIQNGLWLIDLQAHNLEPQKLPFFGAYRWRNNNSLVYVPFDPNAASHTFIEYDIQTENSHQLYPNNAHANNAHDASLTITNNDWRISPDGKKIALALAKGQQMDGIWVIDIDHAKQTAMTRGSNDISN